MGVTKSRPLHGEDEKKPSNYHGTGHHSPVGMTRPDPRGIGNLVTRSVDQTDLRIDPIVTREPPLKNAT